MEGSGTIRHLFAQDGVLVLVPPVRKVGVWLEWWVESYEDRVAMSVWKVLE